MLYDYYLTYYHITQLSPIFPIKYGKFKCHMVTIINQVMKLKHYFMTKKNMVTNQVIQVAKNQYHITKMYRRFSSSVFSTVNLILDFL